MLRGKLEVFSEVGKGSTFRLTLPPTIDARISRAIEQVVEPAVEREGADGASENGAGGDGGEGRDRWGEVTPTASSSAGD
jgi:hypothetical protein